MIGSLRGSTEAAIHQVSMHYGSSRARIFPVVFATSYIIKLALRTKTDNLLVFHLDLCCQIIKERGKNIIQENKGDVGGGDGEGHLPMYSFHTKNIN